MDDLPRSELTPLADSERLPAIPLSLPAAEMLQKILDQMLANERRRVRNEYLRLGAVFLFFLLLILGGGIWLTREVLNQALTARTLAEQSEQVLAEVMAAAGPRAAAPSPAKQTPAVNALELQRTIAELEAQNRTLASLVPGHEGGVQRLLLEAWQARDAEIARLRAQLLTLPAPAPAAGAAPGPAVPDNRPPFNSLTAAVADDLPLRLPIPAP